MDHNAFDRKVRLVTLSLIIPFQVDLRASIAEESAVQTHNRNEIPHVFPLIRSNRPVKVVQTLKQERQTLVCRAGNGSLTPKEREIAALARCRLFQLRNNNTTCQSPIIGLCAVANIYHKFRNGEMIDNQPMVLSFDELEQNAKQISGSNSGFAGMAATPEFVQQTSLQIDKPVSYIKVGNIGCSYGPGSIDIIKRLIFARPNELENDGEEDLENENREVLVQSSWFRDHELLNTISSYGHNSVIICYNDHLKRTVFSMPNDQNFAVAQECDAQMRFQQKTAILSIGKKRVFRNIGLGASFAAGVYAFKTFLWPMIVSSQIACYITEFFKSFQLSGQTPTPLPSPEASPSPLPTPEATPTPVPSPEASPSPLPTPEATPTPVPSPEASPSPLPTPEATPTPVPSPEASPSPLPMPEATPTPVPSPEASPSSPLTSEAMQEPLP